MRWRREEDRSWLPKLHMKKVVLKRSDDKPKSKKECDGRSKNLEGRFKRKLLEKRPNEKSKKDVTRKRLQPRLPSDRKKSARLRSTLNERKMRKKRPTSSWLTSQRITNKVSVAAIMRYQDRIVS